MKPQLLILALLLANITSCIAGGDKVPKGDLSDKKMMFEYAIYFLDGKQLDKAKALELVKAKYPQFNVVDSFPEQDKMTGAQLLVREISNVAEEYLAPDVEYLKYAGRGMSDAQKEQLQSSSYVLLFLFGCEENKLVETMVNANQLMLDLTENTNTILWDEETRECFTREYWEENRLVENGNINIQRQITIHVYMNGDYCRAISLGMVKFGLPDVCVENMSCQSYESIVSLINLTAQTMLENKSVAKTGKLSLDIDLLRNPELKAYLLETLEDKAQKKAEIDIVKGNWEEGDPVNRLIEIAFPKKNPQIAQDELIFKIFGSHDEIVYTNHDEEILAASEEAKAKIPALKVQFEKGLPLGDYLMMKFPFENKAGDREWMWVEIVKWEGDQIIGLLQNEPFILKNYQSGQEVKMNVYDMFDYILTHADGSEEGNETGKLIEAQQE